MVDGTDSGNHLESESTEWAWPYSPVELCFCVYVVASSSKNELIASVTDGISRKAAPAIPVATEWCLFVARPLHGACLSLALGRREL